jgi:hypothetical protein
MHQPLPHKVGPFSAVVKFTDIISQLETACPQMYTKAFRVIEHPAIPNRLTVPAFVSKMETRLSRKSAPHSRIVRYFGLSHPVGQTLTCLLISSSRPSLRFAGVIRLPGRAMWFGARLTEPSSADAQGMHKALWKRLMMDGSGVGSMVAGKGVRQGGMV